MRACTFQFIKLVLGNVRNEDGAAFTASSWGAWWEGTPEEAPGLTVCRSDLSLRPSSCLLQGEMDRAESQPSLSLQRPESLPVPIHSLDPDQLCLPLAGPAGNDLV